MYETVIDPLVPDGQISDEFRIRQVAVNLISNAIKYTDEGKVTLDVRGRYTGEDTFELELTVTDTGRGIRKEDQENLFDAFSRADIGKNRSIEGTGLGLAIVKSIVDSMDGTISVDHMMPDPDGLKTLSLIRSDERSKNINTTAIVLTANAVAGSRQMYMDVGFADYLTKPLSAVVLEQTVKKFLPEDKLIFVFDENDKAVSNDRFSRQDGEKAPDEEVMEFAPVDMQKNAGPVDIAGKDATGGNENGNDKNIKERLSAIKGLDLEMALRHTAGNCEILSEIVDEMADEALPRVKRMKDSLDAGDFAAYAIDAHAIKGNMATLGLAMLSERARKLESAAKQGDGGYIIAEHDAFALEYEKICRELKG